MNLKQDQILKKLLEKIELKDSIISELEANTNTLNGLLIRKKEHLKAIKNKLKDRDISIEKQKQTIEKFVNRINELEKDKKKDCEEDCKDCEYCEDCEYSKGCDENREKDYEELETERLIKDGHSDQCAVNQAFAGSQCNCKKDWYFIFGGSHAHPNGYVKIFDTFNGAREEMFRRYGSRWCTQHDESYMAKIIKEYGMHEVE